MRKLIVENFLKPEAENLLLQELLMIKIGLV